MPSGATTRNLVILGMHRSGTSMVAGALAPGLHIGSEEELLAPQADNPRGFSERRDVVALNDYLLERTGSSWYRPGFEPVALDPYSTREMDAIFVRLGEGGWLLKDPRFLLTWPAWEVRLRDALLLFVYRGAEGVVSSLEKRNGLPLDYGLALWQHYNQRALEILRGREFVALSYESFAANPSLELTALLRKLQNAGIAFAESGVSSGDVFDHGLDHTPQADSPIPGLLNIAQRELHSACLEVVHTGSVPADFRGTDTTPLIRIDSMARAYAASVDARVVAARLQEKSVELETALHRQDALLEEHRALAEAHRRDKEEVQFLRENRGRLQAELAERDCLLKRHDALLEEHRALADAHRRDEEELQFLRKNREQLRSDLAVSTERADQLQASLALNEQELKEANDKADYLFFRLELSYHNLLSFAESGLGGLCRGVAGFYKLVTGQRGQSTAYEGVLRDAAEHFSQYQRPAPSSDVTRMRLLANVVRYVFAHPVASLRGFSLARLKRAIDFFLGSDRRDVAIWVNRRFPKRNELEVMSMLPELEEGLDSLELKFRPCAQPRVSIIIPVFNQYRMTMFCLRSLLEHSADVAYEVILADDASTDDTATIEQRVEGIKVKRGSANLGFVRNCNAGAELATGEYLLFLNNDTGLTDGWLSSLVRTLDQHPGAGVVGPKFLCGDGTLQEAGGIVWDDASGWNYGRMDDPGEPAYNYLREVDYVSGACLLVRCSLWQKLDGFDTRYAPAYYEDTDLCFAAREAGYLVLYQPTSVVFHFEGVSNGTDLKSGIKQHQIENQKAFASKWQTVLRRDHFPSGQSVFQARDRSRYRRTILVIDHYVPSYDKDAGSRSTWQYLQLFVEMGYNVKFIGANFFPHQPYTGDLQQMGVEVLVGESMSRNLDSWLQCHAADIHAVYVHRPHVAEQFLGSLGKMQPRPTLLYFGHDLHYLRKQRELEVSDDSSVRGEAADWRRREYRVFEQMDHVYYPSQVEVDEILGNVPDLPVRAIPLYLVEEVPLPEYSPVEREGMLFVGGFNHPPNSDGVRWFIEQILPLVQARAPDLALHLVGSNMPHEIQQLKKRGIVVHGYLDDTALREMYARMKMVVVPLRFGAGVKGKVIEALQQGVPLVSTSVGAEGLPGADRVMHIADDPASFAEKILAVNAGNPQVNEMLQAYSGYLSAHFSKARARDIIRMDFGEPLLDRACGP